MSFSTHKFFQTALEKGWDFALNYLRDEASQGRIAFEYWDSEQPLDNISFDHGVTFSQHDIKKPLRILNCLASKISFYKCPIKSDIEISVKNPEIEITFTGCEFSGTSITLSGEKTKTNLQVAQPRFEGNGVKDLKLSGLTVSNLFSAFIPNGDVTVKDCTVEGEIKFYTGSSRGPVNLELIGSTFEGPVAINIGYGGKFSFDDSNFKGGVEFPTIQVFRDSEIKNFKAARLAVTALSPNYILHFSDLTIEQDIKFQSTDVKTLEISKVTVPELSLTQLGKISELKVEQSAIGSFTFNEGLAKTSVSIGDLKIPASFKLNSLRLNGRLKLENLRVSSFSAHSAELNSTTIFNRVVFDKAPEFFEAKVFSDTSFVACEFKDHSDTAEGAYRHLKHLMLSKNNWVEEQRFTSLELHSNWKSKNREIAPKIIGWVYHQSNRFGVSLSRPFFVLFFYCFLLGMIAYCRPGAVYFDYVEKKDVIDKSWRAEVNDWGYYEKGVAFSLINSLGPLKLHPSLQVFQAGSTGILVVSSLQSLFSSYLWFLIFSWIRRRFRTH